MDENKKYETIKKLVETGGNKQRAAISLSCSQRHINRMINGYKEHGKAFFVHGNKGRAPAHTLASSIKNLILDLYRNKYWEANFEHFQELLAKHEDIHISTNAVCKVLMEMFILSPKADRATKKDTRKRLESIKASGASKKEITAATNSIIGF